MRRALWAWAAVASLWPAAAQAGDWVYQRPEARERAFQRWRWSASTGIWVGTYDRPQRACDPSRVFGGESVRIAGLRQGLRVAQVPGFGCPFDRSDEVGLSAGADVAFRVASPLYATMGLDLVYTEPDSQLLQNQVMVAMPFGILVTWYEWVVRPILHLTLTPMVFITDGNRDFTAGGDLGLGYRILDFGDVALTVGRHWSTTVDHWTVRVAVHPM